MGRCLGWLSKHCRNHNAALKVLMAADLKDMDLIFVLYHAAGRIGEVLNITLADVKFENRWIRFWTRKRKGSELQEDKLAMTDTLYDVLKKKSRFSVCENRLIPLIWRRDRDSNPGWKFPPILA